jgi:hypothetical protein
MKKLMTILGAFFFASVVLTSCGGPEKDGEADAKCKCDALKIEDDAKSKEAYEKCGKAAGENEKKYKDDEEELKKYNDAGEKAVEECMKDLDKE